MSLRGRYVIDRIKQAISHRFTLPVPPYGDPHYWDAAYQSFGPQDSLEWGDITYSDLKTYGYRSLQKLQNVTTNEYYAPMDSPAQSSSLVETLLGGRSVGGDDDDDESDGQPKQKQKQKQQPVLMLGCGNSRLGEEMVTDKDNLWKGYPIVQTDVSARVVDSMSQRCASLVTQGTMTFVQDDATELSAFRSDTMVACLDKGLVDAIYCSDDFDQCTSILASVHRVLQPGGILVVLSFSSPEFFLSKILGTEIPPKQQQQQRQHAMVDWRTRRNRELMVWESIEVQQLDKILLYRFQKPQKATTSVASIRKKQKGKHRKARKS